MRSTLLNTDDVSSRGVVSLSKAPGMSLSREGLRGAFFCRPSGGVRGEEERGSMGDTLGDTLNQPGERQGVAGGRSGTTGEAGGERTSRGGGVCVAVREAVRE